MISHLITNARQRKTFWNPIRSRSLDLWIPLAIHEPCFSIHELQGNFQWVRPLPSSCVTRFLQSALNRPRKHFTLHKYEIMQHQNDNKKKTFLQFSLKWERVSSSSTLKNQTVCWKNAIWVTFLRMPLFSTTLTWLPVKLSGLKRVLHFRIVAALQHQCSSVLKVKVNLTSFPGSSLFYWRENTFSREDPWNEAE